MSNNITEKLKYEMKKLKKTALFDTKKYNIDDDNLYNSVETVRLLRFEVEGQEFNKKLLEYTSKNIYIFYTDNPCADIDYERYIDESHELYRSTYEFCIINKNGMNPRYNQYEYDNKDREMWLYDLYYVDGESMKFEYFVDLDHLDYDGCLFHPSMFVLDNYNDKKDVYYGRCYVNEYHHINQKIFLS